MDTRLLRVFCAVAREGNLALAAKVLHLTPSALSHSLKALEEDLRSPLFDRVGKRMLLNRAGERLLAEVQGPLASLDRAAEEVRRMSIDAKPRLRTGAAASLCRQLIPRVLRDLRRRFEGLELQIASGDITDLLPDLRSNRIDVALGLEPDAASDLQFRTIFADELLLVLSPKNPLALSRTMPLDELAQQPFIFYRRASLTTRLISDYLARLGIEPKQVMEIASIEGIKELVKLNLGVSVLAPWTVEQELSKGVLKMRPIGSQPLKRRWVIAWLKGRRLSAVEEAFCQISRAHSASMRMDRRDIPKRPSIAQRNADF